MTEKSHGNNPIAEITLMGNEHFHINIGRDYVTPYGLLWCVVVVCEDCGTRFYQGWFKKLDQALREGNETCRIGVEIGVIHNCAPVVLRQTRDADSIHFTN